MPQFTDDAIILSVHRFAERDALVAALGRTHGLCRGIVKRGLTPRQRASVEPGAQVVLTWRARLEEHLGTITLEPLHQFSGLVMHRPLALSAVGSAMALLQASLAEHDPHPPLYDRALQWLQLCAAAEDALVWLSAYVRWEQYLLHTLGFGLDLSRCAATGAREALLYVSPNSGRAVSAQAGAPYRHKLLPLPPFLHEADAFATTLAEIDDGLRTCEYFLTHRLLAALHRPLPAARQQFAAALARQVARSHAHRAQPQPTPA